MMMNEHVVLSLSLSGCSYFILIDSPPRLSLSVIVSFASLQLEESFEGRFAVRIENHTQETRLQARETPAPNKNKQEIHKTQERELRVKGR